MYYYKIAGENRLRIMPDKYMKGDPFKSFDPMFYDKWTHKVDETNAIDLFWIREENKNEKSQEKPT